MVTKFQKKNKFAKELFTKKFKPRVVTPKKGKLVLFKSDIKHYGKPTNTNKKVAVGALKSID